MKPRDVGVAAEAYASPVRVFDEPMPAAVDQRHSVTAPSLDRAAARVRWLGGAAVLGLGALHVWSGRHAMNVDGVSYLDMGDAFLRGDWGMAINAHWSPLYAVLLGVALYLTSPGPYWEFAVAHGVNFAVLIAALAAFDFLAREVVRGQSGQTGAVAAGEPDRFLPAWSSIAIGYALFLWSSLQLIELWVVTPDLSLAAVIYLATALVLRIRRTDGGWGSFAVLGAVLGTGYLVKAPMLPLALVFLAATIDIGRLRRGLRHVAVAALAFALVIGPFVIAMSLQKGRVTFGDSRTLAYAWFVNGVPFRHWQGGDPAQGVPVHPTRQVVGTPAVFEFAEPVGGAYPVWYDPSYWHEGIKARLDLDAQLRALMFNLRELQDLFISYVQVALGLGAAALALHGRWSRLATVARDVLTNMVRQQRVLLLPALAGLGMYTLVSVFPRYVAPFIVLLWLAIFAAIRIRADVSARAVGVITVTVLGLLAAAIGVEIGPAALAGARAVMRGDRIEDHSTWRIADGLSRGGVKPNALVAMIHPRPELASWSATASWARLARVRIVAEVPPTASADYWSGSGPDRERVERALAAAGATAVVAKNAPETAAIAGWQPIEGTDYHFRAVASSAARAAAPRLPLQDTTTVGGRLRATDNNPKP